MAQKVQVLIEDDLDGSPATETVAFSLDGTEYEIDLNGQHKDELLAAIEPYRAVARKVAYARPSRMTRTKPSGGKRTGPDTTEVREWAKAQGIEVKERGRIPAEVVAKYLARNDPPAPGHGGDGNEPKLKAVPSPEFKSAEDPTGKPEKKTPARTGRGRAKAGDATG